MNSAHRSINAPNHLQWMAHTPNIQHLRIDELILPGSHNSGSDKQAPETGLIFSEIAQDVSPLEQLRGGIRVLDLRVVFHAQYVQGDPARFQLFHLTSSGRTVAVDIVEGVRHYLDEIESAGATAKEIIILDFHQFKDFTDQAHAELQTLLFIELGSRVIPYSMHGWTVEHIWTFHPGKNVVVAYNDGRVVEDGWDGVSQRWPGENLFNTNTLKTFVDQVAREYQPAQTLTAVQCAKYSLPFHAPSDLSHKVDEWFESVDENSFIQNFYIINTDWSLRSDLVNQCRHANEIRGARKETHPDEHLQPLRR